MKMPIVSLNNMAMNESVAATCCFKADKLNGYDYETVLYGGIVVNKPSTSMVYGNISDNGWLALDGDYAPAVGKCELIYQYIDTAAAWKYGYYHANKDENGFTALTPSMLLLANCDHKGSYCNYVSECKTDIVRVHTGSTVEHAASKNWAADHPAIRFNS